MSGPGAMCSLFGDADAKGARLAAGWVARLASDAATTDKARELLQDGSKTGLAFITGWKKHGCFPSHLGH